MRDARVTGFTVPTTLLLPPFDGCTIPLVRLHNDSASHTFPPACDMQQRLSVSSRGLFSSGSEFIYTVFNRRRVALRFVRTVRLFNDLHQLKAFTKVTIPLAAILEGGKADFVLERGTAEKFRDALKTFGNIFFFFRAKRLRF